MRQNGMK